MIGAHLLLFSAMEHKIVLILFCIAVLSFVKAQTANGVTCEHKKVIVNSHNNFRQQLANTKIPGQPKAGNLLKLAWDDNLEDMAQAHANKMNFEHSKNRKDPENRFKVGENIFLSSSSEDDKTPDWATAVKEWFEEYKNYKYKPFVLEKNTGHYTQVIWADTMFVGCGYSYYKDDDWYHKFYVCNYGPAGNFNTQLPYKEGEGCEKLCCKDQKCSKPLGNKCK